MFGRILIATDFSPASACLIQCAAELKLLGLKQVILAHVVYVANTPGLEEILKDEACPRLARQQSMLQDMDIEVTTELVMGIPAHQLDGLARTHEVDAILIGSRGRGLTKAALGSVSFKLLQITNSPIILSRINAQGKSPCLVFAPRKPFAEILFATDFSATAERAAIFLELILDRCKPAITLLHVGDADHYRRLSPEGLKERQELDEHRLRELQRQLEPSGAKISTAWVLGHPAEEIIKLTRTGQVSLVIVGNHGKGFFREALLGSTANEVARRAEAQVLLIPDKQ